MRYPRIAQYFDAASQGVTARTVANFLLGSVFRRLPNEAAKEAADISIPPAYLQQLVQWMDEGKLKMNLAKTALENMLDKGISVEQAVDASDLTSLDNGVLEQVCRAALEQNPTAVSDLRAGKEKAMGALIGFVMRQTRGKADAGEASAYLRRLLEL